VFDSECVHEAVDSDMDAEADRKSETGLRPGRFVKESKCCQATNDRVRLVDQILKSRGCMRWRDSQATLHKAVRQLGNAVSKSQRST
jgi:hypothetical protein